MLTADELTAVARVLLTAVPTAEELTVVLTQPMTMEAKLPGPMATMATTAQHTS